MGMYEAYTAEHTANMELGKLGVYAGVKEIPDANLFKFFALAKEQSRVYVSSVSTATKGTFSNSILDSMKISVKKSASSCIVDGFYSSLKNIIDVLVPEKDYSIVDKLAHEGMIFKEMDAMLERLGKECNSVDDVFSMLDRILNDITTSSITLYFKSFYRNFTSNPGFSATHKSYKPAFLETFKVLFSKGINLETDILNSMIFARCERAVSLVDSLLSSEKGNSIPTPLLTDIRVDRKNKVATTPGMRQLGKGVKQISILTSHTLNKILDRAVDTLFSTMLNANKQSKRVINSDLNLLETRRYIAPFVEQLILTDKAFRTLSQNKPLELLSRLTSNKIGQLIDPSQYHADCRQVLQALMIVYEQLLDRKSDKDGRVITAPILSDVSKKEILKIEFMLESERRLREIVIERHLTNLIKIRKQFSITHTVGYIRKQKSIQISDILGLENYNEGIIIQTPNNGMVKIPKSTMEPGQYVFDGKINGEAVISEAVLLSGKVKSLINEIINLQCIKQTKEIITKIGSYTADGKVPLDLSILEDTSLFAEDDDGNLIIDLTGFLSEFEKCKKDVAGLENLMYYITKEQKESIAENTLKFVDASKRELSILKDFLQLCKESLGVDVLNGISTDKLKMIEDLKLEDLIKSKEALLEFGFILDEMYRRWYFMPSDGPYDDPLIPNDNWDYVSIPVNGFNEDPLPGSDKGKGRILVDINIMKNVIDFMELLYKSNSFGYAGCTPEQALKHFVTSLFDWLDHQLPDTIDKIPEFYPESYERVDGLNLDPRDDYWKLFRHIRWYSESIINNISESDKNSIRGIKYVRQLIDRMIEYYKDHHANSDMDIDKFKGFRRRELSKNPKLLKKEEI
jgi:hypothetical protein